MRQFTTSQLDTCNQSGRSNWEGVWEQRRMIAIPTVSFGLNSTQGAATRSECLKKLLRRTL